MSAYAFSVDPSLPAVEDNDIVCPGCGQTVDAIMEGRPGIPTLHFVEPTVVYQHAPGKPSRRLTLRADRRTLRREVIKRLCSVDEDDLSSVVFRIQRDRAALAVAS